MDIIDLLSTYGGYKYNYNYVKRLTELTTLMKPNI